MGLVSKVVPDASLIQVSLELATRLAQSPSQSLSLIKYLVHQGLNNTYKENLALASAAQGLLRHTGDHKEAVRAFSGEASYDIPGALAAANGLSDVLGLYFLCSGNSEIASNHKTSHTCRF